MPEFRANQKVFKDAWLRSPKVKAGEYWEIGRPGFGLRVSDTGRKTFILAARFPGKSGGRRAVGVYPVMTLEAAHAKASKWTEAIQRGEDPADIEEKERMARLRQQKTTFAAVAADFIRIKLAGERKGWDAEREINLDLMPEWAALPITAITDDHVTKIIFRKAEKRLRPGKGKALGGNVAARNLLALIKRLFRWVVDRKIYGLERSPCEGMTASKILGEEVTTSRDRILNADEIYAFWEATDQMKTPVREVYRLLMFAALRLNEAAKMERNELDALLVQRLDARQNDLDVLWHDLPPDRTIWTIPKSRMKGKNNGKKKARDHIVPMTGDIVDIFASLPRMQGPFLFSTTNGRRPVSIGTKIKSELDKRMLNVLRELATSRGQDPTRVMLPHWINHDIRRTVRSNLSQLRVEEVVRESVVAHARKGIEGVYDLHDYREEKRRALQLWAARLDSIVNPGQSKVIPIKPLISA